MLTLDSVTAGYGQTTVLRDVSLTVGPGEVAAILGPNGAGKTTLLRTAAGFVSPKSGAVKLSDVDLSKKAAHKHTRAGICYLPEGRGIFPSLTVAENLIIQGYRAEYRRSVEEVRELFPVLADRLKQTAGSLSGGEQQMLALSRAYLSRPKIVLVDEASLGLAPVIVDKIYEALKELVRRGLALIIVEQYVQKVLDIAQVVYVLSRGEIVHTSRADQTSSEQIYQKYLGVEA